MEYGRIGWQRTEQNGMEWNRVREEKGREGRRKTGLMQQGYYFVKLLLWIYTYVTVHILGQNVELLFII